MRLTNIIFNIIDIPNLILLFNKNFSNFILKISKNIKTKFFLLFFYIFYF